MVFLFIVSYIILCNSYNTLNFQEGNENRGVRVEGSESMFKDWAMPFDCANPRGSHKSSTCDSEFDLPSTLYEDELLCDYIKKDAARARDQERGMGQWPGLGPSYSPYWNTNYPGMVYPFWGNAPFGNGITVCPYLDIRAPMWCIAADPNAVNMGVPNNYTNGDNPPKKKKKRRHLVRD